MGNHRISQKDLKKCLVIGLGSVVFTAALQGADVVTTNMAEAAKMKGIEAAGEFTPGTYTAEAQGIESTVTVTMTFNETNVTDIQIDTSGETEGIGKDTADPLAEALFAAQSAQVDAIAGATVTSQAVMKAAQNCFNQAAGIETEEAPADEEPSDDEAAGEEAQNETDTVVDESGAGSGYIPGSYTAKAQGIESEVSVTLTFDESSITDAQIDSSGETQGLGTEVAEPLAAAILETQGTDFDAVAGATISSEAVRTAARDAIAQAQAGGTEEAESEEAAEEETPAEADTENAASGYIPGSYTAKAQGIESEVSVTLTFDESSITDAQIDSSGETQGLGTEVAEPLAAAILETQGTDFDAVAGATISSEAVRTAARDAIAQAQAGGTEEAESEEAAEEETPAEADTENAASGYIPGSYTAKAQGIESEVSVTLTFDESSITDAQIDSSGETQGLGTEVAEPLAAAILETQGTDFDAVAGATISSEAVRTAARDAIAQAQAAGSEEAQEAETEEATEVEAAASSGYTPGTYSAKAMGMESEVTVTLTVDENAITDVQIDSSQETQGVGTEVAAPLAAAILERQDTEFDVIAGATVSSEAVRTAARRAQAQAAAGLGADDEAAALPEDETGSEESKAGYTPGTYTAKAQGLESEVTVTLTFDETAITDVVIDSSGETPGIGADVAEPLSQAILDGQNTEFDAVAGATVTSEAVRTAAEDAIAQAGK